MPKNLKQALFIIFLILPFSAFAHGEEVLLVPMISIVSVIVFFITLIIIKPGFKCKLPLSVVYVVSTIITYAIINPIPFRENQDEIFLAVAFVPVISALIAYPIIKKFNNHKV
jgi:hypothetical protein